MLTDLYHIKDNWKTMKEFQGIQEFLSQWSSTTEKAKQDATDKKIMIGMFACSKVD